MVVDMVDMAVDMVVDMAVDMVVDIGDLIIQLSSDTSGISPF